MVEVREAKVVAFTIEEAADALARKARDLGQELPSVVENVELKIDAQKNLVVCTFISPLTMKTIGNA
jgi:hypothetical protein